MFLFTKIQILIMFPFFFVFRKQSPYSGRERAAISDPPQSSLVPKGSSVFRYSFCSLPLCGSIKKIKGCSFWRWEWPVSKTRESARTKEFVFYLLFCSLWPLCGKKKQNKRIVINISLGIYPIVQSSQLFALQTEKMRLSHNIKVGALLWLDSWTI